MNNFPEPIPEKYYLPTPPKDYDLADWYQERIQRQHNDFIKDLKDDETYSTVVILNDGRKILPTSFGYHNPNMLVIEGFDEKENEVKLLVPHTNVQILFTKTKKSGKEKEKPQLGFQPRPEKAEGEPRDVDRSVSLKEMDQE